VKKTNIVVGEAVEYIYMEMVRKGYAVTSDDKIALNDIIFILSDYVELVEAGENGNNDNSVQ
jgi:hypothetical protein